jgi:Glycoside hydrolase family 5 C-terminal domain
MLKVTYLGRVGLINNYTGQFARIRSHLPGFENHMGIAQATQTTGFTPVLIGETGIPFNFNGSAGYRSGNSHDHIVMIDAILKGMEMNHLNWAYWTFCLDNDMAGGEAGDFWNTEDFSVVSKMDANVEVPLEGRTEIVSPHDNGVRLTRAALFEDVYKGGRALPAILRPYAPKVAGVPTHAAFDLQMVSFDLHYTPSSGDLVSLDLDRPSLLTPKFKSPESAGTEIFIPAYHFGRKDIGIMVYCAPKTDGASIRREVVIPANVSTWKHAFDNKTDWNYRGKKLLTIEYDASLQTLVVEHTEEMGGGLIELNLTAIDPIDDQTNAGLSISNLLRAFVG